MTQTPEPPWIPVDVRDLENLLDFYETEVGYLDPANVARYRQAIAASRT